MNHVPMDQRRDPDPWLTLQEILIAEETSGQCNEHDMWRWEYDSLVVEELIPSEARK